MLRMGFIEAAETIMAQIPEGHQDRAVLRHHAGSYPVALPVALWKEPQEVRIQSSVTDSPGYQPELLDCLRHA